MVPPPFFIVSSYRCSVPAWQRLYESFNIHCETLCQDMRISYKNWMKGGWKVETLFLACFIGGIVFAVVTVVFGEVIDGVFDSISFEGLQWMQPMTLVGGITVFGGVGLLLVRYTEFAAIAIVLIALMAAIAVGAAVYFLYVKRMRDSENSTAFSIHDLVGKLGEVHVPIPSSGYGEVVVQIGPAGVTSQIAASFDGNPIPGGAKIVVIEVDDGTVLVSEVDWL